MFAALELRVLDMAKEFIKGQKYSHEENMQLSMEEMRRCLGEHKEKTDPKVGGGQGGSFSN
ncbi:MAG: hypothetical protein DA446_06415 [Bacteroidetes bacterium]|jgi:hypothetical protein|nr:MAG: hypothetical protein DA446_06415 [Bacteroidota bacterium]